MKNMKIMAVLVVLLAAALFVGAASAVNTTTIFVNEQIDQTLLKSINESADESVTLYRLSEGNIILDKIKLTNNSRLLPSQIRNETGVWYNNLNKNTADIVYIYYPEITLSAELAESTGDSIDGSKSIDGKSINTNTSIHFLIDAPKLADVDVTDGVSVVNGKRISQVKIVFTTPVGGKTSIFGYKSGSNQTVENQSNFNAINLTNIQTTTDAVVAGTDAVAGTWTAQAVFVKPNTFKDYASKSNSISFNLQSTALNIVTSKDSIIRNNPFTVTISGDTKKKYAVFLEGIDTNEVNPYIPEGQIGLKYYVSENVCGYKAMNKSGQYTAAVFETDASGKRIIQFNTDAATKDKIYTVRVAEIASQDEQISPSPVVTKVDKLDGGDYDTVKVKVDKGGVTVTASGDGHYYIGSEITLSGTNTDSDNIYLFITGPNLDENGVSLKTVGNGNIPAYKNAQPVSVKTDGTWEYKWDTSNSGLDTGSYTIYATSVLTNGKSSSPVEHDGKTVVAKLSDSEYADVFVSLKEPFLSANPSGTIVAKGDNFYIRGTAKGEPSKLQYYIFGPNKFDTGSISVKDDGSYEKKLTIGSNWASNQYYVVIEHPMNNDEIDVQDSGLVEGKRTLYIKNVYGDTTQSSFNVEGQGRLQSLDALNALTNMIDSANIDDIYTKLTFTVDEPRISITNPGDQGVGSKFTISGTTNLAVDDQILVEVQSSSFEAVDKNTTKVVAGEGTYNTWSVKVDTTNWKLDKYTIKASGIEVDVKATTNFNLVEKIVNKTPTATSTSTPATTTATPGFGAFIALAGLGAVALLVLRRN